tara:strand:- start:467 stop:640 length:174 start_codon:yes stop_codon:yes gene_type:complete
MEEMKQVSSMNGKKRPKLISSSERTGIGRLVPFQNQEKQSRARKSSAGLLSQRNFRG